MVYEQDEANEEWPFYNEDDKRGIYTKSELLKLIKDYPQLEKLIYGQTYTIDDDLFHAPLKYVTDSFDNIGQCEKRLHHSLLINHSCDPNVAFVYDKCYALRDVEIGEEITSDYGTIDDENSFRYGLECRCGSKDKCRKSLGTDAYKDPKWQQENEQYCSPYIKKKIQQLRQKGK